MVSWDVCLLIAVLAFVAGAFARPYLFDYDSLARQWGALNGREE
jgi:hypothetical protein